MFKRGDIANNLFLICFTHMECILCGWGRIGYSDVSIHAPARGATRGSSYICHIFPVSIHAPTRGATPPKFHYTFVLEFQSTHPHGVRPCNASVKYQYDLFQSTHPHGVRPSNPEYSKRCFRFQSTHPHGVRQQLSVQLEFCSLFQSTHPHGVRRSGKRL